MGLIQILTSFAKVSNTYALAPAIMPSQSCPFLILHNVKLRLTLLLGMLYILAPAQDSIQQFKTVTLYGGAQSTIDIDSFLTSNLTKKFELDILRRAGECTVGFDINSRGRVTAISSFNWTWCDADTPTCQKYEKEIRMLIISLPPFIPAKNEKGRPPGTHCTATFTIGTDAPDLENTGDGVVMQGYTTGSADMEALLNSGRMMNEAPMWPVSLLVDSAVNMQITDRKISGVLKVRIDSDGYVTNASVISGSENGMNEILPQINEALRILRPRAEPYSYEGKHYPSFAFLSFEISPDYYLKHKH